MKKTLGRTEDITEKLGGEPLELKRKNPLEKVTVYPRSWIDDCARRDSVPMSSYLLDNLRKPKVMTLQEYWRREDKEFAKGMKDLFRFYRQIDKLEKENSSGNVSFP